MAKSKKGKAVIAGVAAVSAASILTVRGIFHKVFARQEKEDDAISLRYKDMSGMVRKKITIHFIIYTTFLYLSSIKNSSSINSSLNTHSSLVLLMCIGHSS